MRIRIRIRITSIFSNCGSGFRIRIPDPGSGSRVWWPKIEKITAEKKINLFFGPKTTIYLSLGLHKGRPSYRRSLQPSKKNIQHFKTWKFCTFFYFCGSFSPSWIRIRIRNLNADPDPDPKPWFFTLLQVSQISKMTGSPSTRISCLYLNNCIKKLKYFCVK
jgi:hypothetical protein